MYAEPFVLHARGDDVATIPQQSLHSRARNSTAQADEGRTVLNHAHLLLRWAKIMALLG